MDLGKLLLVRAGKVLYDLYGKQRCFMRQVLIYAGEDGYWVAECPSLPGCISQGKDKAEALENIREAIRGYVAALEEDNLPVPEERFEALLVAV
jgi:predicted RNase H-like HicB family nuclease